MGCAKSGIGNCPHGEIFSARRALDLPRTRGETKSSAATTEKDTLLRSE
jgi:hypothetical protein